MSRQRSFFDVLSLCLRSKCPVCAEGELFIPLPGVTSFRDLLVPPENCRRCGFKFGREPGYYFGVLTPVLPILSVALGASFSVIAHWVLRLHLHGVLVAAGTGVLLGLLLFFRTSIAIYIALDHSIDPPKESGRQ